jgi:hypothetical protein
MLISSSIYITSVEVRGVQLGGGALGFPSNLSLLLNGLQRLLATSQ